MLMFICMYLAGMFSCLIMLYAACVELVNNFAMLFPIPMPQDVTRCDLHYMSFEEAAKQPFSDEHQSSLQIRRRDINVLVGDVAHGNRGSR